ncbi:MAG: iron hydrogenase small subunit, partial [Eubacterium sp.]|nr:iron hydrogenase small subunit [Eubacterium sp.]
ASDIPFGLGSGGGVIFGVSGGVTEAVLRRITEGHDQETLDRIAGCGVREDEFIREFSVPYKDRELNICVVSGLADAGKVMNQVRSGEKHFDLIEVMACRRGCIMGGGQPRLAGDRTKAARRDGIYKADHSSVIRKCNENPTILSLYDGMLKGREHKLLHNEQFCAD